MYLAGKYKAGETAIVGVFSDIDKAKGAVQIDFEKNEKRFPIEKMEETLEWGRKNQVDYGIQMAEKLKNGWIHELIWIPFDTEDKAYVCYARFNDGNYNSHRYSIIEIELDRNYAEEKDNGNQT